MSAGRAKKGPPPFGIPSAHSFSCVLRSLAALSATPAEAKHAALAFAEEIERGDLRGKDPRRIHEHMETFRVLAWCYLNSKSDAERICDALLMLTDCIDSVKAENDR